MQDFKNIANQLEKDDAEIFLARQKRMKHKGYVWRCSIKHPDFYIARAAGGPEGAILKAVRKYYERISME